MKKVTSSDSLVTINHYRNLLESEGIRAFLRNEHFASIMGEVPFQEVWPELWVRNDLDYDRALQLIDAARIAAESPAIPIVLCDPHSNRSGIDSGWTSRSVGR